MSIHKKSVSLPSPSLSADELDGLIGFVPDIEQYHGVNWVNMNPLLANPTAFDRVAKNMARFLTGKNVNKIVAIASHGILFGAAVADRMNLPLVIAGNSGKMPGLKYSVLLSDRHRNQNLEIDARELNEGDRIGIVDDRMMTGRSIAGLSELLKITAKTEVRGVASLLRYPFMEQKAHFYPLLECLNMYSIFEASEDNQINRTDEAPIGTPALQANLIDSPYQGDLKSLMRIYPHFPHKTVMWTDYNQILSTPRAYQLLSDQIVDQIRGTQPDLIVTIAVRGLHFSTFLARRMNLGQVVAYKTEKMCPPYDAQEYLLEYGASTMGLPTGLIKSGQKVLIIDDIMATGGTAEACVRLVQKQQAEVTGVVCPIGLPWLYQKSAPWKRTLKDVPIFTSLNFSPEELESMSEELFF